MSPPLLLLAFACFQRPEVHSPVHVDSGEPAWQDTSVPGEPGDTGIEQVGDGPAEESWLFNEEEIPVFTLRLSEASAELLGSESASSDHQWVEASLTYRGRTYEPVGLRLKGENSFESFWNKPSLKVDLNRYQDFSIEGLKGFTLNNMHSDYSMMHERLAYRAFREAGVPAYRANHALVYIEIEQEDGTVTSTFYGLYALLENADKHLVREWFEDDGGSLFEIWDVDFYDGYVPCPNEWGEGCFQLEFGEDDRTHIQAVADAMELSGDEAVEAADPVFSWDDFINYWAVCALVSQYDGYPYSSPGDDAHIYDDPTTGKLWFMPHGADESFYYPDYDFTGVNGIVARRCEASSNCMERFRERVWEVYDLALEWDWESYFEYVREQIEPYVEEDTNKSYDNSTVWTYQSYIQSFIETRERYIASFIGARPRPGEERP